MLGMAIGYSIYGSEELVSNFFVSRCQLKQKKRWKRI